MRKQLLSTRPEHKANNYYRCLYTQTGCWSKIDFPTSFASTTFSCRPTKLTLRVTHNKL